MEDGLIKGTSNLNYPDNVLLDDFEEFEVEDTSEFNVGDLVEMDGIGNVIPSIDMGEVEGCPAQEIEGFRDTTTFARVYLGNGFFMSFYRVSATLLEVLVYKKLKSGYLELVANTEITTVSNTAYTQPKVIREAINTKNHVTLENGRSVHSHSPHLSYVAIGSIDNSVNNLRIIIFNTITTEIIVQNNVNPFGRAFANTTSGVFGSTSVFEVFLLEQKLDTATGLVPVMKTLMWNKAGGSSAYFVTLTEINHAGVVTVISGEVNIMTADIRMIYNCVTSLDGNVGGVTPANNIKGLFTINKVMYLYHNITTSSRLEARILDIAGNTLTNGIAYIIKVGGSNPGRLGGLVSLSGSNRVIIHDLLDFQLYTVTWSGSVITPFGNQTQSMTNIFTDGTQQSVQVVNSIMIIRLNNDCVMYRTGTGNTNDTGRVQYVQYRLVKCFNDATVTYRPYAVFNLHYMGQPRDAFDNTVISTTNSQLNNFFETEDGIAIYDQTDKIGANPTNYGSGVYRFFKVYDANQYSLLKTKNVYLLDKANKTINSNAGYYAQILTTSNLNNPDEIFIDDKTFITLDVVTNTQLVVDQPFLKLFRYENGIPTEKLHFNFLTPVNNLRPISIHLISKNKNGDFNLLCIYSREANGTIRGVIINYNFVNNTFTVNTENLLYASTNPTRWHSKILNLQNNKFIMIHAENITNIFLRHYQIVGNNITLLNTLNFTGNIQGIDFEKITDNAFLISFYGSTFTVDNWAKYHRIYALNDTGFAIQSLTPAPAVSSGLGFPGRSMLIPLDGLRFLSYDYGLNSATVSQNRMLSRMLFVDVSPIMSNENTWFLTLKSSILNYGLQDTMGVSDAGSGNAVNLTAYNQIFSYVKISDNKIAFAVLKAGTKKVCIEVYDVSTNGLTLCYSTVIWYLNEYNNTNTAGSNILRSSEATHSTLINLYYVNGKIFFTIQYNNKVTLNYLVRSSFIGFVDIKNYLGLVCKVKEKSVVVTKKPIKLNRYSHETNSAILTKDGTKLVSPIIRENETVNNFADPKTVQLSNSLVKNGYPFGKIDKNGYLRFIANPKVSNNQW